MIINPISGKHQLFIGEIKTISPYSTQRFNPDYSFYQLAELAIQHCDYISIHTSALWGGSLDSIDFISNLTDKPILAKAINGTDKIARDAINAGADYVLIVNRIPDPNNINPQRCFFECDIDTAYEIKDRYARDFKLHFVYNSRDLRTGKMKPIEGIKPYLDLGAFVCQASGIKEVGNIHPNVDAFIVGENLVEFCKNL